MHIMYSILLSNGAVSVPLQGSGRSRYRVELIGTVVMSRRLL